MIINLIFSIAIIALSVVVLKSFNKKLTPTDDGYVFILTIAIFVGLWSAFAFGVLGAGTFYEYVSQGEVDYLQSEIDENNPPILPPMTLKQCSVKALPSALGVIGALSYVLLGIVSLIRQKIFYKWIYITIGWNLCMWVLHIAIYPYFRPLPTVSQNIMFLLFWGLPSSLSILFSIFWINLLIRKQVTPVNSK